VLFTHCKNNNDSNTPKNLIGDAKMVDLLTEIHLVEGSVTPMLLQSDSATQYVMNNYNFLFKKYNTDQDKFKETMHYYVQHPKELDKVYEQVIENLSKMQSEIK
jgi:hypothetical protein